MLVGDRIIAVRRLIPDPPPTLPAPTIVAQLAMNTGGTLTAGAYYLVVTQRNLYGETIASNEVGPLTVTTSTGQIQFESAFLPGAVAIRAYLTLPGGASGSEIAWTEFLFSAFPVAAAITSFPTNAGVPPERSSAFLPDSDGKQYSAAAMFEWLNLGLNRLSFAVGGLLNYGGCQSIAGQPLYVMPGGQWLSVSDLWYGGYWMQGGNRANFFRRNAVTSDVLQSLTISVQTDKQVMEVSYQPDRTSVLTQTQGAIGTTDTGVAIANTGFLLPFGFAAFGVSPSIEFVSYASLANGVMSGMVRGMGNTVPQNWPIGTIVTEMGFFWNGRCVFTTQYFAGQSSLSIPVPSGWETILDTYMLAQAKKAEQDLQGWEQLEKDAFQRASEWMLGNKGVAQRIQVGEPNYPLVYQNTPAGGIILPS